MARTHRISLTSIDSRLVHSDQGAWLDGHVLTGELQTSLQRAQERAIADHLGVDEGGVCIAGDFVDLPEGHAWLQDGNAAERAAEAADLVAAVGEAGEAWLAEHGGEVFGDEG